MDREKVMYEGERKRESGEGKASPAGPEEGIVLYRGKGGVWNLGFDFQCNRKYRIKITKHYANMILNVKENWVDCIANGRYAT
jgi:hypothetical protein